MLRVALIGTGRAARARIRELAASSEAILVFIASATPERAAHLAEEHGVTAMSAWEDAVAHPDVDAIIVSTYNERHAAIVRAALEAGKHVCVEYPLALSLIEGVELLDLALHRQRVLHVEHIDLLSPWFQTILTHLTEIGELRSLTWQDISARQPQPGDWTFDRQSGFSLFAGASVLSRLVRLAGPAARAAVLERLDDLQPDGRFRRRMTNALLEFQNGVSATITDATGMPAAGPSSFLTLFGTLGMIQAVERRQVTLITGAGTHELPLATSPGLFAQDLSSFCRQVTLGEASYLPVHHVRHVLAAAQLAHDSLLTAEGAT